VFICHARCYGVIFFNEFTTTSTIFQARKLVNHIHVLVNGRMVYQVIVANLKKLSSLHEELTTHLTLHPFQYKRQVDQIIDSKWVGLKINELLAGCRILFSSDLNLIKMKIILIRGFSPFMYRRGWV